MALGLRGFRFSCGVVQAEVIRGILVRVSQEGLALNTDAMRVPHSWKS